jgi:NADPH-dependent 2,4-dienoyl-CoA reductase/sulfur reductase-like enzyme
MRLIIIGGVAAGAKAAAKAHRTNPDLEIILYQDEAEVSYSACGLPYILSGKISNRDEILIRKPEEFKRDGINVETQHYVESIDYKFMQLIVKDLKTNTRKTISYDRLILATGARAIIPPIKGVNLQGVVTLRSIEELDRLKYTIDSTKLKKVIIIGAGYIGLELSEAFHELGIATTLVEKLDRILPRFDPEMAQLVHDHLIENNVEIILNDGLVNINGKNGRACSIEIESGRLIEADLIVLAIGIKPNIELAKKGGVTIGETGAIKVNTKMETNLEHIYAAGDCCETIDRVSGEITWVPLGDIANLQGRVAGDNAAGGNAHFPGTLGTSIFKTFDLNVAITGLSETAAKKLGFTPKSVTVKKNDKARYYPGGKEVIVKLIADKKNGQLLGGQVIGQGASDKMIDITATALLGALTCYDMENADLAYSPPFSPVLSPIIVAAGALSSMLKK